MDLFSQRSYSDRTSTSAEAESEIRDESDKFNELVTFYNQVIGISRKTKGKSSKIDEHTLEDKNCNRKIPDTLPCTLKNENNNLHINNDNVMESQNNSNLEPKIPIKLEPKLSYIKSKNKYEPFQNTDHNIAGPAYAEKSTYCRPGIDMYSRVFVYKTMQKNARLQDLVRRLVLAREREKQRVAWNNYINELKNKHRYNSPESRAIPNYMPNDVNQEIIDYYNTRFTRKQSDHCQILLQDLYSASNEIIPENKRSLPRQTPFQYENNRDCYPTSSQGRLMMLNPEKHKYYLTNLSHKRPLNKYLHGTPILVKKENFHQSKSKPNIKQFLDLKKHNPIRNLSVQTEIEVFKDNTNSERSTEETFKDKYEKVNDNVVKLKKKIIESQIEVKNCTLTSIENKLDILIKSINSFIIETKSQRSTDTKCEGVSCQLSNYSSQMNTSKSDTFGPLRRELICGIIQERPKSTLDIKECKKECTLGEMLYEEMHKSNKAKRDIEEILNKSDSRNRPSVHITFDIPTKERATEITDSLIKTRHTRTNKVFVEEIGCQDERQMTIAVNTDPLGLLALFRVSAETVKQILSFMPHIDYYSYLSKLPLPQMSRNEMSHYVCNICGAAFDRPSQLSDHIQVHNLGNPRNCCVCRHDVDRPRHRAGLFPCQHCGQRFTRAYCRELHQQACGSKRGGTTDITTNLLLLQ